MVAGPSSPIRSRISFMCQNWCYTDHVFNIRGASFTPKPDVDVGVVHMIPRKSPYTDLPFALVEKVTRQCFIHKRKPVLACAETLFPPPEFRRKLLAADMISEARVPPGRPTAHLDNEDLARLCEAYNTVCGGSP